MSATHRNGSKVFARRDDISRELKSGRRPAARSQVVFEEQIRVCASCGTQCRVESPFCDNPNCGATTPAD